MGFVGPERGRLARAAGRRAGRRAATSRRDDDFMASVPGVFVAGDAGRGQSLIVWAIAEGRSCAAAVDRWLTGEYACCLRRSPPTGRDRCVRLTPARGPIPAPAVRRSVRTSRTPRMRRAKIVCTLGPAVDGRVRELVEAGMDVARLNLSHGAYEEHQERYHAVREASDETRPRGRRPRRPAGPEDPARPVRRRPGRARRRRTASPSRPRTCRATSRLVSTTYNGPARRRPRRRHHPGRRRQGGAAGHRRSRARTCVTQVEVGGAGLEQQGAQPARRRGERAGDVRQGRGRPALGAAPAAPT